MQETNLAVEELDDENENETETPKQKYFGGYEQCYDTVAEAKENPVVLEDGTTQMMTVKRKKKGDDGNIVEMEVEVEAFKLFEVRFSENDLVKPVGYLWSRSNQTALSEYAEMLGYEASQYGSKRGRAKVFKPDQGIVALGMQIKELNDKKHINAFIAAMPQYEYLFRDIPQPETI